MTGRKIRLHFLLAVVFFAAAPPAPIIAASQDGLLEAARREGELVYYASMNVAEANAEISAFEKRYPFIKVKLNRIASEKLLTRVLTEARTKKIFADVIQTVEFSMHIFSRSGILARYTPPANSIFPQEFKEEGFWEAG